MDPSTTWLLKYNDQGMKFSHGCVAIKETHSLQSTFLASSYLYCLHEVFMLKTTMTDAMVIATFPVQAPLVLAT